MVTKLDQSVEIHPKSPDVNLETRPDIKVVRNTFARQALIHEQRKKVLARGLSTPSQGTLLLVREDAQACFMRPDIKVVRNT